MFISNIICVSTHYYLHKYNFQNYQLFVYCFMSIMIILIIISVRIYVELNFFFHLIVENAKCAHYTFHYNNKI